MDSSTDKALAAMAGAIAALADATRRQSDALEAIVARSDSIERQLRVQTRAGQQLRERLRQGGPVAAFAPPAPPPEDDAA